MKNTPPEMRVVLGTATSHGKDDLGSTLLEIRCKNEIPFNATWLVVTRENRLVSPFMTAPMKIVPEGTPIFKIPIQIKERNVVGEYIELRFTYDSIHSPELGNPPHLRGEITLPFRFFEGGVYWPTPAMMEYWRSRQPLEAPSS